MKTPNTYTPKTFLFFAVVILMLMLPNVAMAAQEVDLPWETRSLTEELVESLLVGWIPAILSIVGMIVGGLAFSTNLFPQMIWKLFLPISIIWFIAILIKLLFFQ